MGRIQKFEFASAARIIFGSGSIRDIGTMVREFGRRALLVTGRDASRAQPLLKLLRAQDLDAVMFSVAGEPDLQTIENGTALARRENCELVIGFGGGSALDAGKAIAAMAANDGELLDYVEIIGRGQALTKPSLPFIAIPTTAGTGSEVTRNAVLASPEHRAKVSLRSPLMLPRIALVDPELTLDLPPAVTASTGLDALTQLIEPYVCSRANPMTDALCVEGIRRVSASLRKAFENGRNLAAREDMALASLFGGIALANAGLGAVHGLAGPIGGMFPAPHGAVVAALLPHVIAANIRALRQRQPEGQALRRYDEVARLLTGRAAAQAEDTDAQIRIFLADLQIAPLRTYGLTAQDSAEIAARAAKASSMKANPVALTNSELTEVLGNAL
jgi:alcohol dehydrogenase class IV